MNAQMERRKVEFDTSTMPRHWVAGDALLSRWLDAMSLGFPEGERAFIKALRDYRATIGDEALLARVRDFSFQETQHALVHAKHNERLGAHGIDVERLGSAMERLLGWQTRTFSPKVLLAWTVACEHFTSVFACVVLQRALDILRRADPEVRALYLWHAMEEIEHRSVAWEVYDDVADGGYLLRTAAMIYVVAITLGWMCGGAALRMLHADGSLFDRHTWRVGLRTMVGRRGLVTLLVPEFLAYFKPGFHPDSIPVPPAYERWMAAYRRTGDVRAAAAAVMDGTA